MNKLFVDTSAFQQKGLNFDIRNPIISTIIKNVENGKYEFCNLSVIDNEIISHLGKRCLEEYKSVQKRKWIKNYISDEEIKNNCYKDLTDYTNFKKRISAILCDVSIINPEKIFSKYFKIEYPFENNKDKRKEFPDAFISEYINLLSQSTDECVYFVSSDDGLRKSINEKVKCYDDLESFLSDINKVSSKIFESIEEYILNNYYLIQKNLFERFTFEIEDLNDEKLEIENIEIKITDIKVIDKENDTYYVSCTCNSLDLFGDFIFLEPKYNLNAFGEIIDFEPDFLELHYLTKKNYEFIIKVNELEDNNFSLEFLDKYIIKLSNETIEDSIDYDAEGNWDQDGGCFR